MAISNQINIFLSSIPSVVVFFILLRRKQFPLYGGIVILLFSISISGLCFGLFQETNIAGYQKLSLLGKTVASIYLVIFSEYILKLRFEIWIKAFLLTLTVLFGTLPFFKEIYDNHLYLIASDIYSNGIIIFLIIKLFIEYVSKNEDLIKKYQFVFMIALITVVSVNMCDLNTNVRKDQFSYGTSALMITYGIVSIIAAGSVRAIKYQLRKTFILLLISFAVIILLKFLQPTIDKAYLYTLSIVLIIITMMYYVLSEIFREKRSMRTTYLINRLLELSFNNRRKLLYELKAWEEIKDINLVHHSKIEGNISNLNLLFDKTDRVIHKNLLQILNRSLEYDEDTKSGIDTIAYYFKKLDCDLIFQISDKGDFIAIKFILGLNPVLYSNVISIMAKIVYTINNSSKNRLV